MWYFAWILGVLLAICLGIINAMWLESEQCLGSDEDAQ
jgi:cyd operon protein YbgT